MAFCSTCGTQGNAGTFCTNCGSAIADSAPAATMSATAQPAPNSFAPAGTSNLNSNQNQKTNSFAIVALVVSLAGSLFFLGWVGAIFGHISLSQIKRTGEKGRGMAIAGLVIGYAALAGAAVILGLVALGTAVNTSFNNVASSL